MLDFELAEIYGYITTRFDEQVKNKLEKFGDDFMIGKLRKFNFKRRVITKMVMKRKCMVLGLLFLFFVGTLVFSDKMMASEQIGVNNLGVEYRSKEEIKNYIQNFGTPVDVNVVYDEIPLDMPPYSLGKVSDGTLTSALKLINQIRYIAGLPSDVILNDEYTKLAQAASVVNYANGFINHYPPKPDGICDELYNWGRMGASKSNLGRGYHSIHSSILYGYMEDGDSTNIERVGHRRWILNPSMKATGFGYFNKSTALYALDGVGNNSFNPIVAWPAQNMPIEYMDREGLTGEYYPWSISVGYNLNMKDISVELIRLSDNKVWNFSESKSDGYFNVDNGGYGQTACIIFRPNGIKRGGMNNFVDGDEFLVTVRGLKQPLSYKVSFFNLYPEKIENILFSSPMEDNKKNNENEEEYEEEYEEEDEEEYEEEDEEDREDEKDGNGKVSLDGYKYTYTGKPITPKVNFIYNEKTLTEGQDFIAEYENNVEVADSPQIIIRGINNYRGEYYIHSAFSIHRAGNKAIIVSGIVDKMYSGDEIEQNPIIKTLEGDILEYDKDYTLYYENNIEVGEATLTILFDNYEEYKVKFHILPLPKKKKKYRKAREEKYSEEIADINDRREPDKYNRGKVTKSNEVKKKASKTKLKPRIDYIKLGKNSITVFVKLKKDASYKLQYSTDSKMKKSKTLQVKKAKIVIKKLAKGKSYYIRVGMQKKGKMIWGKVYYCGKGKEKN